MSLRVLTPLLALMITSQLSAADRPEGDRPQGPPPGALFERFDQNGDHLLSRPEFVRGMAELQRPRPEGGDQERPRRPDGDGEGRPQRPAGDGEGRPPRPHGDGEGHPPRPAGDGEGRPPRPAGDGEARPRPEGDGEGRPRPEGAGPLEKAFEKGDADKSGTLTREEFHAAMQSMPRPPANRPPGQGEGDRPRPQKEK